VSERAALGVESEHPGVPFIGQSAQLIAIKNETVAHGRCLIVYEGRCLICMHGACKWIMPNHRVLACRCMQMVGACLSCMHEIYSCVWVHCYAFLYVSLLVLAVICARKNIDGA